MGVMGPRNESGKARISRRDNRYKDPLKSKIPKIKNQEAILICLVSGWADKNKSAKLWMN